MMCAKKVLKLEQVVINAWKEHPEYVERITNQLAEVLINHYGCSNVRASIQPYRFSDDWSTVIVEGEKDDY